MGGARRDSLTLLKTLLEALMENARMGIQASKTRIVSMTGLNPYSFNNYILQAERSGGVTPRPVGDRVYYEPTFRTALLAWALSLTLSLLEPPAQSLERYSRLLGVLRSRLEEAGVQLYMCLGGPECSIPADALIGCGDRIVKLYLGVEGDPLNYVRALALLESVRRGEEVVLVTEGVGGSPQLSLLGLLARSLGLDPYTSIDALVERLASVCGRLA